MQQCIERYSSGWDIHIAISVGSEALRLLVLTSNKRPVAPSSHYLRRLCGICDETSGHRFVFNVVTDV